MMVIRTNRYNGTERTFTNGEAVGRLSSKKSDRSGKHCSRKISMPTKREQIREMYGSVQSGAVSITSTRPREKEPVSFGAVLCTGLGSGFPARMYTRRNFVYNMTVFVVHVPQITRGHDAIRTTIDKSNKIPISPFAIFKKKSNSTIDLLSLGIYAPRPQVLTSRPQILQGVRI